jgi:hypothetical protein
MRSLAEVCGHVGQAGIRYWAMALEWIENYEAMVGWEGMSLMAPAASDQYARFGNREYYVNQNEEGYQKCYLTIFVAGHPTGGGGEFSSLGPAKQHAEEYERNARYAEGYYYAQLKQADTVSQQTAFGNQWAYKYADEGLTIAQAWEDYKSGSST